MSRPPSVRGGAELTRVLRRAPGYILGETEKSLFKAGGLMKRAAQALAPLEAGTLKERKQLAAQLGLRTQDVAGPNRIKRNILVKRSRGYARGMPVSDRNNERIVVVYVRFSRARKKWDPKNVWYGHYIEWGHAARGGKRWPQKPFMTPTWQAHEAQAERQIQAGVQQAINTLRAS